MLVAQLEDGRAEVENQYARSVSSDGNRAGASASSNRSSKSADRKWRGIGNIPMSGLRLRPEFAAYDAERIFGVSEMEADGAARMHQRAGAARAEETGRLPGLRHALHARIPLGAPMVSTEGACAAYYQYRRHATSLVCIA